MNYMEQNQIKIRKFAMFKFIFSLLLTACGLMASTQHQDRVCEVNSYFVVDQKYTHPQDIWDTLTCYQVSNWSENRYCLLKNTIFSFLNRSENPTLFIIQIAQLPEELITLLMENIHSYSEELFQLREKPTSYKKVFFNAFTSSCMSIFPEISKERLLNIFFSFSTPLKDGDLSIILLEVIWHRCNDILKIRAIEFEELNDLIQAVKNPR